MGNPHRLLIKKQEKPVVVKGLSINGPRRRSEQITPSFAWRSA
jgi:hypothetical protein